jgi:hypothetical protein
MNNKVNFDVVKFYQEFDRASEELQESVKLITRAFQTKLHSMQVFLSKIPSTMSYFQKL